MKVIAIQNQMSPHAYHPKVISECQCCSTCVCVCVCAIVYNLSDGASNTIDPANAKPRQPNHDVLLTIDTLLVS
jgi:hypothetical protein